MPNSELTLDDFSGGFTDNYLGGRPNKYERGDNFKITSNKKLASRDGSAIIDATYYQLPDGAVRLGTLLPFDKNDTLFWHYARKIYYVDGGWVNLVGPTGNQAFDLFTTSDYLSWGQWQKQLFVVPSSGSLTNTALPIRMYQDEDGTWQLRTAGLPRIDNTTLNYVSATKITEMVTLANAIRTKMLDHLGGAALTDTITRINNLKTKVNAHFADAGNHTTGIQAAIATPNATDKTTLMALAQAIMSALVIHYADAAKSSGRAYHPGQYVTPIESFQVTGIGSARDFAYNQKSYFNSHDSNATAHAGTVSAHQYTDSFTVGTGIVKYLAHDDLDTAALAILTSAACTDYASCITLTSQMLDAYELHLSDAVRSYPLIHRLPIPFYAVFGGDGTDWSYDPNNVDTPLLDSTHPTDEITLAARLNDLRLRFALHAGKGYYHGGSADSDNIVNFVLPPTGDTELFSKTVALVDGVTVGPYAATDWTSAYRVANALKDAFIRHVNRIDAVAGPHKSLAGTLNYVLTYATSPETLADLVFKLRLYYYEHTAGDLSGVHFADSSQFEPIDPVSLAAGGTVFEPDFYGSAPHYHYSKILPYLNDLVDKFNDHVNESAPHNAMISSSGSDHIYGDEITTGSYIWALHYEYTYSVGSVEYVDRGPLTLVQADNIPSIEIQTAVLSAIPVLANTGQTNYDTTNLKIRIARTPKNGVAFYYCGEISNGTTTFSDKMTDAVLLLQEPLYTEGGVVENDPPPMAKAFHICDNVGYYGNVVVDGEYLPNRVQQSHSNDIDSVPATFYVDLEHPVTFISSAKSRVVVATNTAMYRIDGIYDERGQGGMVQEKISDVGSECPQSAVQAGEGVFYLGTDGVYYTDGYRVLRLNEDWTKTYQTFISTQTKRDRIVGTYDDVNQLIYWTIQATSSNTENDSFLILDLRWGISPESTFLTHSNGVDFKPSAVAFFNKQLLRGDSRGYVFKHGSTYTSDPKVDTGAIPSTWAKKAISWDYISVGADFGNAKLRKFIPSMNVTARNLGNLSLQCVSYNDDQDTGKSMKPIRFRGQYTGLIREGRMMPAGGLRCNYKQIQLTNANVIIENSDTLGNASVTKGAGTGTVTLDSAVTEDWPTDAIDWMLYFDKKDVGAGNVDDGYNTGYVVSGRTADTLTVVDAGGTLPTGSVKWVLKGTPKDEQFELQAINVAVQMLSGDEQGSFQKSETGSNA